ncbi:uncharacterized protein PFL1_03514 [Pseudozyma flocculosa PF-1]|uniref:Related to xap-5 protein n=2 Tax=Pseudozyma flocculosa TaxID=84751 RepID=A0A5C3F855_9BASI|nr:uncharacterized protein PFL1_03514 [Pseudozyma flocculosa PF-1]EPQ28710.1 hypothetical protein PFL1_03514 [Pseudozyma flocculosa PF-1]SPO39521.1 related to xap-5 protein [Pseudozyma flocculosa]
MSTSHTEHRRQGQLEKARAAMLDDFERQKAELAKQSEKNRAAPDRFQSKSDSIEETLKKNTVGLVRLEDFQKRREELEEEKRREAARSNEVRTEEKKKRKDKKGAKAKLSFALDDEEDDDASASSSINLKRKRNGAASASGAGDGGADDSASPIPLKKASFKNPNVDTSFLPDRNREEEERRIREELRQEWLRKQDEMKNEDVQITYSYWDGTGHRKVVKCKKGDSIAQFLEKCRQQTNELRGVSVDNLMYIKEDLIIPHHYTFYDFIVNKTRGKSGPLFNFDVHDDIRLVADATVEKDESHAGKVVERTFFNRNKHVWPYSRWEVFDPNKDYGSYTIHDRTKK